MATAVSGTFAGSVAAADPDTVRDRFLLSNHGCGRATGYAEANKIVTHDGQTHVAWLDSPAEGFRVRVRTLDRGTGQLSPTYSIGEAHDNHGGPALTIDGEGFLHVVYFPHHDAMRYRKSKRPGDASEWEPEVAFGERLTYPTLVCGKDNTLYLTARRSFRGRPWQVELWKRPADGQWQRGLAILASRHTGYAHFQESLAWGPDHRTLHLCCRFHEKTDGQGYGRLQTVAYLSSSDAGESWQRSDGAKVSLPATAESAEALETGGVDRDIITRAGALAVSPDGWPQLVYSVEHNGRSRLLVARPMGDGRWRRTDLTQFLPSSWSAWNLMAPAGVTFTAAGEMIVTAQIQRPLSGESAWGNRTNEVLAFRSRDDGAHFSCSLVSVLNEQRSHWLPNIERPTGHNVVGESPAVIYTGGGPGTKNTELLSNDVLFATLQANDT